MKLFSKNDIQKKKTEERAREVAQGVSLATRVNELREKTSFEEVRNREVVEQSRAATDQEIGEMIAEKNSVASELQDAKNQLAEARKPLDAEWEQVKEVAATNEAESTTLAYLRMSLEEREEDVTAREVEAVEVEKRNALDREMTQTNLLDADALRTEAQALRDDAVIHVQVQTSSLEKREALVASREENAESREKAHAMRDAELDERERFLNEEERRISDLAQTITRTKNRNNGN